jgi:hypothetical protein
MYFEVTKRILSLSLDSIAKLRKITRGQALKQAAKYLALMSDQWYAGEAPQIAYEDPLCRWAYVYAHVPAHANLFEKVLEICARGQVAFRNKLSAEELSVIVFGGGPGTELLGLAKYFFNNATDGVQTDVEFQLVDRVSAWSENLTSMQSEINNIYAERFGRKRRWPARFNTSSYPLDFSDLDSFGNLPALFDKQLFVFSFVISEVFDLSILTPIMTAMGLGCPAGAHFLFIDRADAATTQKIDELINELKLEDLGDADIRGSMDTDEEKAVLREFFDEIGRAPRLTWNARWKLARKPKAA